MIVHLKLWYRDDRPYEPAFWEARPDTDPLRACYIYRDTGGFTAQVTPPTAQAGLRATATITEQAPRPRDTAAIVNRLIATVYGPDVQIRSYPPEMISGRLNPVLPLTGPTAR